MTNDEKNVMKKQKIIFIHGGQGSGKSTVTNLLREKMTHTTLLRLAGVPSDQDDPCTRSFQYHMAMLEGVNLTYGSGMNFIFDRSFLCDKIYANLGFKSYDFEKETEVITSGLKQLATRFEVYFVLLMTSKETLEQRLKRGDKPQFEQVKFSAENSLKQQEEYAYEFEQLPDEVGILMLPTDDLTAEEVANRIIELTKGE